MKYFSTEHKSKEVSFKDAIITGLAPDRGLYFPDIINKFDDKIFDILKFPELSFEISKLLIEDAIPENDLKKIIFDAFNFQIPIKNIKDNIYVMELFHGPTAAFKDFGARFMARVLSFFLSKSNQKITILVATSGDTGSAVAKGFYKVPNIDVVILYPSKKVSFLQEKQLTTLGENITALEVDGTFDDCQNMVKEAFIDKSLNEKFTLSSANSINIGRLYPQSFYYVWAYNFLKNQAGCKEIIFCTPSGNFGNLTGGLIAKRMGLPVKKFIAATNINDVVPEYLDTGIFKPRPSLATHSNAMDVGNPSNFARMTTLYKTKDDMKRDIVGYKITDKETVDTIKNVYEKTGYLLDPHGAVAYKAIEFYKNDNVENNIPMVFLETAHPAKFNEVIKDNLGIDVNIPKVLKEALKLEKKSIKIGNRYEDLKSFLENR
ncbi:MAG TPA: threonine synthase [Spirochaetota bacterium]|nr:threonine synthase [Spirochaetota bacterium]